MVVVGLAVTATHRPLVRFALLKQRHKRKFTQSRHTHRCTHTAVLQGASPPARWNLYPTRAQVTSALAISDPS